MEARIVTATGMSFAAIKAGKFRRDHFATAVGKLLNLRTIGPNARDVVRTVAGVADSLRILRRFKPDVVFIKGGYVGVPVGLAARILRIPYVIHESDVSPGLANRFLGRWAEKIGVGFPVKNYSDFDPARLVYVGNPVRSEMMSAHRLEGLARFRLEEDFPVVLITGGSQGAAQINDAVIDALPDLLEKYQIIHLTGEGELSRVKFELSRRGKLAHADRYHPYAFLSAELGQAYAAADLVISRAGVNAITDSAVLGKPTVLIPNYQMAGHQVENARVLSRLGAVRVLDGRTLTTSKLVGEIRHILEDPEEQDRLSKAIRSFGKPDAARELAELVLEVGRERASRAQPEAVGESAEEVEDGEESLEETEE